MVGLGTYEFTECMMDALGKREAKARQNQIGRGVQSSYLEESSAIERDLSDMLRDAEWYHSVGEQGLAIKAHAAARQFADKRASEARRDYLNMMVGL